MQPEHIGLRRAVQAIDPVAVQPCQTDDVDLVQQQALVQVRATARSMK
jgi:hypothetical protein